MNSCASCKYAEPVKGAMARCRRFPPQVKLVMVSNPMAVAVGQASQQLQVQGFYPPVNLEAGDGCGEWSEKPRTIVEN